MVFKRAKRRIWDRRRRKRASSPTNRVYKRRLLSPKKRPGLLKILGKRLADPEFFKGLESLEKKGMVKKFFFEGVPIVVKNTAGISKYRRPEEHGINFGEIRRFFLAHQKAVHKGKLKPKNYILRSPKVYGRVGNFLIVEYVERMHDIPTKAEWDICGELIENFKRFKKKAPAGKKAPFRSLADKIKELPQVEEFIPVGNTTPKNPKKGKWVVFLPYDYV